MEHRPQHPSSDHSSVWFNSIELHSVWRILFTNRCKNKPTQTCCTRETKRSELTTLRKNATDVSSLEIWMMRMIVSEYSTIKNTLGVVRWLAGTLSNRLCVYTSSIYTRRRVAFLCTRNGGHAAQEIDEKLMEIVFEDGQVCKIVLQGCIVEGQPNRWNSVWRIVVWLKVKNKRKICSVICFRILIKIIFLNRSQ